MLPRQYKACLPVRAPGELGTGAHSRAQLRRSTASPLYLPYFLRWVKFIGPTQDISSQSSRADPRSGLRHVSCWSWGPLLKMAVPNSIHQGADVHSHELRSHLSSSSLPRDKEYITGTAHICLTKSASLDLVAQNSDATATMPQLPPEIWARILSYHLHHNAPVTMQPRFAVSERMQSHQESELDLENLPTIGLPPFMFEPVPPINLLLVNRTFYNEGIKQFYSDNTLTILGDHAYDFLYLIRDSERALVRDVVVESLWNSTSSSAEKKMRKSHTTFLSFPSAATPTNNY